MKPLRGTYVHSSHRHSPTRSRQKLDHVGVIHMYGLRPMFINWHILSSSRRILVRQQITGSYMNEPRIRLHV
ncbi:hypothetical protein [uncultured Muribaculum sp.]|uniref:hypothetical protein n=1 Tax=uncultured Muribaculum sp. TaxID=1918613 RepID=UPI0025A9B79F|nr:hypothetical protein [uncultured Muribaculum sp.]